MRTGLVPGRRREVVQAQGHIRMVGTEAFSRIARSAYGVALPGHTGLSLVSTGELLVARCHVWLVRSRPSPKSQGALAEGLPWHTGLVSGRATRGAQARCHLWVVRSRASRNR